MPGQPALSLCGIGDKSGGTPPQFVSQSAAVLLERLLAAVTSDGWISVTFCHIDDCS